MPAPTVRGCQDPEHGCSPAFGKAVTSCHCYPWARRPTQVHRPVGWDRMWSSMGKRREDCQTFPKEVTAMFLQTQLLQCDITPDGKWNEVSVTRMCHAGAVFYIQISHSALVRKGVNSQQSRRLPISREASSWHRKLWERFWSKVLTVGKEPRDRGGEKEIPPGSAGAGLMSSL